MHHRTPPSKLGITTKFKFELTLTNMVEDGCRTGDSALRHAPCDNRWANFQFLTFVTNKYEPRMVHATALGWVTVISPVRSCGHEQTVPL
jgi:hypothetical protein